MKSPIRTMWRTLAVSLVFPATLGGCGGSSEPTESGSATLAIPEARPDRNAGAPREVEVRSQGRFRKRLTPLTPEQQELARELEAIGYAAGSREAPPDLGVVRHVEDAVQPGLNVYSSGHAPQAVLIDMQGRVLHTWQCDFEEAFPGEAPPGQGNAGFWRRVKVFDDGEIIAIHTGFGILRLDRDSNLIWARRLPVHHDFRVAPDGKIYVLTRKAQILPDLNPDVPILEDFVAVLDAEGQLLREVSLIDAYDNTTTERPWTVLSSRFWERESSRKRAAPKKNTAFDVFHTNALELLDGRTAEREPAFQAGNVLLSLCHLDTIAVVDLERTEVVWALEETFQLQHDPTITPGGDVLVFDNHWRPDRSRVAIVAPESGEVVWQYDGTETDPFYSRTCGTAQCLGNGNVLAAESDGGRALEVTPEKRIVWEFFNPNRAGEDGEYIATLFELVRLPLDFGAAWLEER